MLRISWVQTFFSRKDGKSFADFLLEEKRVKNTTAPRPTTHHDHMPTAKNYKLPVRTPCQQKNNSKKLRKNH